ncbi:MAG: DUF2127 domain-containing protein [Gaiellaceae bacterium]
MGEEARRGGGPERRGRRRRGQRHRRHSLSGPDDRILSWIALERGFRAVVLTAAGAVLVAHPEADWGRAITVTARKLGLDPSRNVIERLAARAHALRPHELVLLGLAGIAYGVLEGAEAYGIYKRRRWGEYLTVVATSLLLAPETWELAANPSTLKAGGLVVNVAIVAYLARRLRRRAHASETTAVTRTCPGAPSSRHDHR